MRFLLDTHGLLWWVDDDPRLPVFISHVVRVHNLTMYHKDPFDRLLIAQAQVEDLTILSNDAKLRHYPVNVSW